VLCRPEHIYTVHLRDFTVWDSCLGVNFSLRHRFKSGFESLQSSYPVVSRGCFLWSKAAGAWRYLTRSRTPSGWRLVRRASYVFKFVIRMWSAGRCTGI